jgi:hypothetical protein
MAYTPYTDVLVAALSGGEGDIREALADLDMGELSRLRNAMRIAADYAEDRRKHLWRSR